MSLFFKNRTKKYLKSISCGIFDNDYANAFAQTKVAEIVRRHLAEQDGRQKKVLIYGLYCARADSKCYVIPGNDEPAMTKPLPATAAAPATAPSPN